MLKPLIKKNMILLEFRATFFSTTLSLSASKFKESDSQPFANSLYLADFLFYIRSFLAVMRNIFFVSISQNKASSQLTRSSFWKYCLKNVIGFSGRNTQSCTIASFSTRWMPAKKQQIIQCRSSIVTNFYS